MTSIIGADDVVDHWSHMPVKIMFNIQNVNTLFKINNAERLIRRLWRSIEITG
ncbi:MAG: hypothetical protein KDC80_10910 [Saprospiraceae bacterium]|nr:hypothetical protein [Saprospiraceae bacterium]